MYCHYIFYNIIIELFPLLVQAYILLLFPALIIDCYYVSQCSSYLVMGEHENTTLCLHSFLWMCWGVFRKTVLSHDPRHSLTMRPDFHSSQVLKQLNVLVNIHSDFQFIESQTSWKMFPGGTNNLSGLSLSLVLTTAHSSGQKTKAWQKSIVDINFLMAAIILYNTSGCKTMNSDSPIS